MKKNLDNIFSTIEIDPITDQYHIVIPEEIMHEFDWYEDFVLKWNVDNGDIFLTEAQWQRLKHNLITSTYTTSVYLKI